MKRRQNLLLLMVITLIIGFLLFSCIIDFSQALKGNLKEQAFSLLDGTAQNHSSVVYAKLDGQFYVLRTLSHLLSAQRIETENILQIMDAAVQQGEFGLVVAVDRSGFGLYSNGAKADLGDRKYFQRALQGEQVVELIEQGAMTGASRFILAIPIEQEGKIVGVLAASYSTSVFENLLLGRLDQQSRTLICDSNDTVLADDSRSGLAPGSTLTPFFSKLQLEKGLTLGGIRQDIAKGEKVRFSFFYSGQHYYASCSPLTVNNWYIISFIPEQTIHEQYSFIRYQIIFLTAKLVLVFLLIITYVLITERQKKRTLEKEKEILQLEDERYRVIGELSDVALFEGNLLSGTISFSHNHDQLFGWIPTSDQLVDYGVHSVLIHPEDRKKLQKLEKEITPSVRQSITYRITDRKGGWIWCRTEFILLPDKYGRPCRLFGKVANIDRETREINSLRERATLDSLTKLLNNESTRTEIEALLTNEPDGTHSLLVIDVDNFKQINDTYGHDRGDTVLKAVAGEMLRLFRSSDIVGRVGGDEFVVLLKDTPIGPALEERLFMLCELLSQLQLNDGAAGLTCSIGCAVYPACGKDYQTLYKLADKALYSAKHRGKNQYVIFYHP